MCIMLLLLRSGRITWTVIVAAGKIADCLCVCSNILRIEIRSNDLNNNLLRES